MDCGPTRRRASALILAVGSLAAWAGGEAVASPSSRLVYVRSPDALACGDESVLRAAVAHRFGYDPFFSWAHQTVVVQISRADKRYRAQVQVVDENGVAHGNREITSDRESCDELLDATALAISIALDASASAPSAGSAAAAGASSSETPSAPPAPAPTPTPTASTAITALPSPAPTRPERRLAPSTFVGVDVLTSLGTAPSPSAGLALFGGIRARLWSAALELRADAPAGAHASSGGGSVSSWLLLGGFVPCWHVKWASFCAVGQLGTLQAQGSGVSEPRSGSALVTFVGVRAGAELALSDVFALRARIEGLFDLHQPTLNLGATTVWPAPVLAGDLGVGLVVHIP